MFQISVSAEVVAAWRILVEVPWNIPGMGKIAAKTLQIYHSADLERHMNTISKQVVFFFTVFIFIYSGNIGTWDVETVTYVWMAFRPAMYILSSRSFQ